MNLRIQLREAWANLLNSKLRSLLTLLGVLVGTASVVALVSSGQLATEHALEQFKTLGTDLLAVSIEASGGGSGGQSTPAEPKKLTITDIPVIKNASDSILLIAPYTIDYSQLSYEGVPIQGSIIGATDALRDIIKIKVLKGRFVSYLDRDEYFAVIGSAIANKLKTAGLFNPIGKQIRVGNIYYTIIGVAGHWEENMFMYADINNSIIIPIGTALGINKFITIQNIIFKLRPNADIDQVQNAIIKAVNSILPNAKLFFRSAKQLIDSMRNQEQTFTLMLGSIGGISLIVGGIGVMNIMLVSVVERRREIGIRMAVGAKRRDIQNMFLTEAVVLTLFGGLLGVVIGVSASFIIAIFSRWAFHFFILPPLIGFIVSAVVGIFFGIYPAIKASRLNPIDTLRSEV